MEKIEELARVSAKRQGAKVSRTARPEVRSDRGIPHLSANCSARRSAHVRATRCWLACVTAPARRPAEDMSADAIIVRTVDMTHRDWLRLNERRFQLRRAWACVLSGLGRAAVPGDRHRRRCRICRDGETWERRMTVNGQEMPYNDMLFWPGLTCGYHLPASVAPIGVTRKPGCRSACRSLGRCTATARRSRWPGCWSSNGGSSFRRRDGNNAAVDRRRLE